MLRVPHAPRGAPPGTPPCFAWGVCLCPLSLPGLHPDEAPLSGTAGSVGTWVLRSQAGSLPTLLPTPGGFPSLRARPPGPRSMVEADGVPPGTWLQPAEAALEEVAREGGSSGARTRLGPTSAPFSLPSRGSPPALALAGPGSRGLQAALTGGVLNRGINVCRFRTCELGDRPCRTPGSPPQTRPAQRGLCPSPRGDLGARPPTRAWPSAHRPGLPGKPSLAWGWGAAAWQGGRHPPPSPAAPQASERPWAAGEGLGARHLGAISPRRAEVKATGRVGRGCIAQAGSKG